MARIKIEDLEPLKELTDDQLGEVVGGLTSYPKLSYDAWTPTSLVTYDAWTPSSVSYDAWMPSSTTYDAWTP